MDVQVGRPAIRHEKGQLILPSQGVQGAKYEFQPLLDVESGIILICGMPQTGLTTLLQSFVNEKLGMDKKLLSITHDDNGIKGVDSFHLKYPSRYDNPQKYDAELAKMIERIGREDLEVLIIDNMNFSAQFALAIDFAQKGGLVIATTFASSYEEAVYYLDTFAVMDEDDEVAETYSDLVSGCVVLSFNPFSSTSLEFSRMARIAYPTPEGEA